VGDVHEDVGHDDEYGGGQHETDDQRQVALVDRLDRVLADATDAEHGLDHHHAAEQRADVDAELGHHRRERRRAAGVIWRSCAARSARQGDGGLSQMSVKSQPWMRVEKLAVTVVALCTRLLAYWVVLFGARFTRAAQSNDGLRSLVRLSSKKPSASVTSASPSNSRPAASPLGAGVITGPKMVL